MGEEGGGRLAAIGVACLLGNPASPGTPCRRSGAPGRRQQRSTDFAAYERRSRASAMGLPRSTGSKASTRRATGQPLTSPLSTARSRSWSPEHWTLGEYGGGEAVPLHAATCCVIAPARAACAPPDGWYERTMTLYFEPGRFVGGTGTINGRPADRTSTRCAAPGVGPRRSRRIAAARCRRSRRPEPGPLCLHRRCGVRGHLRRRWCAPWSSSSGRADRSAARQSAPASSTPMTDTGCAGGRRGALGGRRPRPVPCTLAASSIPLRLAPGNYPLFDPRPRRQTTGRAFCST